MTILEMLAEVATDLVPTKAILTTNLIDIGVEILTSLKVIKIIDSGVIAVDRHQNVVKLEGDRVVLAMGLKPQTEAFERLRGQYRETCLIGDCVEPRRLRDATREGYNIGSVL